MTETEILAFAGVAVTAVLGFIGARATARSARASAQRSSELESFRLQLTSRDDQIAAWRADAETMRKARDAAEEKSARRIRELETRVDELTDQLEVLVEWARTAAAIMRTAHIDFPQLPDSVQKHGGS